jgi:hypothetical protein
LLSLLPTRCLKNFASKAKVRHLPTNYDWAYEMQVEDLDGHAFRFGLRPEASQPILEWLDMRGNRSIRSAANECMRVETLGRDWVHAGLADLVSA